MSSSAVHIDPMPGPFGASVVGLDSSQPLSAETVEALRAALDRYHVLVVDDQDFDPAGYARFGAYWGVPISFFNPRDRDAEHPELIRITNSARTPVERRDGAMHWHQDSTYEAVPAAVTMLNAVEAPAESNDTMFADLTAAFGRLHESTKQTIGGLRVIHDPRGGRPELFVEGERRGNSTGAAKDMPTVRHPLVVRHPGTGRSALYGISGTAVGIEGMDEAAALELLVDVKRHALADRFRLRARARQRSILIWDNLAVMHCATATTYSDADGERRLIYRISTRAGPLVPQ